MLEGAVPYFYYNQYDRRRLATQADALLVFEQERLLLQEGEEFLCCEEVAGEQLQYLFAIGERGFYLWREPKRSWVEQRLAEGARFLTMREVRNLRPEWKCFAAGVAYHLYSWYERSRFCGRCGGKTEHSERERAMLCPACGNTVYPRISPGVIVRVTDGERVLLTRYAGRGSTSYALVAGFNEIGETLEDTVRREVMEEVGLRVKNIRYYKNQAWTFSQSLLVGFTAELEGDACLHRDETELADVVWVRRDEMPVRAGDISMTAEMMERFRLGLEE